MEQKQHTVLAKTSLQVFPLFPVFPLFLHFTHGRHS